MKKIAESNRKKKKLAAKLPKQWKTKKITVPGGCPFKDEIMREVEEVKQRKEDERKARKEQAKQAKSALKQQSLEEMVVDAENRDAAHQAANADADYSGDEEDLVAGKGKENSLKTFFKEFKKVVDAADVILEVVDARDPLGTRCEEVQQIVRNAAGVKKLVLVLNKADLVPRENLEAWLKYLRKSGPVVPFKATTQTQKQKLGRIKFPGLKVMYQRSPCVGADILMSLLANYCRNNDIKTSIRVGIVGIPNVGKSSIINSLKRKKACNVGAVPGVTRQMQEVEIDKNIKLIDSPGIVFQRPREENPDEFYALKNAQDVNKVQDPYPLAADILRRASMLYFCRLYNITEFHSVDEFLAKKAQKIGRFGPGGVPDVKSAARSLIHDWNTGKIKYFTQPPEDNPSDIHLDAAIIASDTKAFGLEDEDFEKTTNTILDRIEARLKLEKDPDREDIYMEIDTKGPVHLDEPKKKEKPVAKVIETVEDVHEESKTRKKKRKAETIDDDEKRFKEDPIFRIDGNMSLNKANKKQLKKMKKNNAKHERKVDDVADLLDNFSVNTKKKESADDDYDFDEDYDSD